MQTLRSLEDQGKGILEQVTDQQVAAKLLAMGVTRGKQLEIIRRAPFRGGYYVEIDGKQRIAIRKEEAKCIMLQP